MSSSPLSTAVLTALRALGGIATSAELQLRLKASQPTVSRALAPLLQAGTVRKVGAARSQRYVLPRHIPGVGGEVPVMRVDTQGQASPFGRLLPLQGGGIWAEETDGVRELHDGLPWLQRRLAVLQKDAQGVQQATQALSRPHP